jgi:hypothetical protein
MMAPSWVPLGPLFIVVGVQVLDELRPGLAERERPGAGVAVGVAGIGEDVAERDPGGGHRGQDGNHGAHGIVPA